MFTIQSSVFANIGKNLNQHPEKNTQNNIDASNYIHFQRGFSNNTQIDDENFSKKSRQSSLAFVFDATGSMSNDLAQLKVGAQMILNTMLNRENPPIKNYVLIPYRDPGTYIFIIKIHRSLVNFS